MDIDMRSEKSHELGLKYLDVRHQEALVAKDEEVRRQKVQVASLQQENGQLKDNMSQLDRRVNLLSSQYDDARLKLDGLSQKCREQDNQLKSQAREHSSLRTELLSLNNVTHDSTKVLTEKLALSREIAVLKPEVEHLRSQLTHQKDVLAEKLALERQLNALEVELANDKRTAQRAAQRQTSDDNEAEDGLRQQVQDLEKRLASEKRAREKAQSSEKLQDRLEELEKALADEKRESQRAKKALETELSEARGQIDVFELRVGDLKAKLREVREELKGARAELSAAEEKPLPAVATAKEGPKKTKAAAAKPQTQAQRKRRAEEPSGPELAIQTPGIGNEGRTKRPLKKRGIDPSMAVQKSTFSITPFLNKTTNPMDESPGAAPAADVAADKSKTSDAEKSVTDKSTAAADSTAPEEESELPEDSIMGRRVSASATLSSVDITDSSSVTAAKATESEAPKRRGRPPKEKVLGEAAISKKNMKVQPAKSTVAVTSEPPLSKVTVETAVDEPVSEQENQPPPNTAGAAMKEKKSAAATAKVATEAEPKKKKRKILGANSKTVFDEEDDDGDKEDGVLARPVKPAAAAPAAGGAVKRSIKTLGGGRATAAGAGKRTMLGGMKNAFGAVGGGFSPLKRDRRGVNASFLA